MLPRFVNMVANAAEVLHLNRLQFFCYDLILRNGWDGFDTFVRLDLFDGEG